MILSSKDIAISVLKRIQNGEDSSRVFETTHEYLKKYKLEALFHNTLLQLKLLAEREDEIMTSVVSISHEIDDVSLMKVFENLGIDPRSRYRKSVNKDLILGFVIKSQDKLYSYNLKKYLEDIKQEIAK